MSYRNHRQREEDFAARFEGAKLCSGGVFDCDCACAAPPDFSATAAASEESARIMADLGREQIAESKRQYDLNRETSDKVVASQLDLMDQAKVQGDDYYDYMKTRARPVEDALNAEAMAAGSDAKQQEASDRAVADSQGSFTRTMNQALRQGKRYGITPSSIVSNIGVPQAAATAAAATGAREREKTLGYAKKLDVAGMYRGLPGASQGAYSVSTNAGNSATQNQMAPGQALIAGNASGASMTGQGQGLRLQGLSSVLSAQTNYANAQNAAMNAGGGGFGDMLGGLGSLGRGIGAMQGVFAMSSKKLKTNRRKAGKALDGVRKLEVGDWKYKDGVADEGRHVGPYAEDVKREFGDKVAPGGKMLDMVSMQGVMLKAIQELDQKVDKIEKKSKKRGRTIEGKARRVE